MKPFLRFVLVIAAVAGAMLVAAILAAAVGQLFASDASAQQQVQRRCTSELASPPKTPESREHLRNCDNPLTTDEYFREVQEWSSQARPTSEAEFKIRVREFQRILARERQRQAEIKRNRN